MTKSNLENDELTMESNYILTVRSEDRTGLLHLIAGILNKKLIPILNLSSAETDIPGIVLVTMEIRCSVRALGPLILKLENIIEVCSAEAQLKADAIVWCTAFFKLNKSFLSNHGSGILSRYGASIVNIYQDAILVATSGRAAEVDALYRVLDGPHLLGFSRSGLIADSNLLDSSANDDEDIRVIRQAA